MRRISLILPALALALATGDAHALDETRSYGIGAFGGPNQCETMDKSHSAHTKSANAFADQFYWPQQFMLWGASKKINNGSAGSNLFTDAAKSAACNCSIQSDASSTGIDTGAVAYLHTHGGHNTAGKGRSAFSMGNKNAGTTCSAGTDTNFLFGQGTGGKLELAIIKACQGADYTVWKQGGYWSMTGGSSRFQLYNGFHGDSSCGDFVADYVEDYAGDSLVDGIGENWIDEAYEDDGPGKDDCPTTIVFGNSKSARKNMFENGGFIDRKLTNATKSGSAYFYVAGCWPKNGVHLPE